jgi:hypothetical protein
LAGASRTVFASNGSSILDYRVAGQQTTNGLDKRFGAGQVNLYNSYKIIAGVERNSQQDGGAQYVSDAGFDYDPSFGGASGSNSSAYYDFPAGWTGQTLAASLVWNAEVDMEALRPFSPPHDHKPQAVTLHDSR